jgi:hypothetical protein
MGTGTEVLVLLAARAADRGLALLLPLVASVAAATATMAVAADAGRPGVS